MKNRYELYIDPIDIPEDQIYLFKNNEGKWDPQNHKAINWLCTKIENSQTSLILEIFEEED